MTPLAMAALHGAAFVTPRPWSEAEFRALLASPLVFSLTLDAQGLLLGRVVADEAELLTLAVALPAQGQGLGRRLVDGFLAEAARRGAALAFLEVAEGNARARHLYQACGFAPSGRRRAYFHGPDGVQDAIVMQRALPPLALAGPRV